MDSKPQNQPEAGRPNANVDGAGLAPRGSAQAGGAARGNSQSSGNGGSRGYGQAKGNQGAMSAGVALGPLTEGEAQALLRAIDEEWGAHALYQSVLDTFGTVYPFDGIAAAESQHAAALLRLAEKYALAVPAYNPVQVPVFESIAQACQAAAAAEIADAALYDELIPLTTHTDVLRVYENLKRASLENHLPAFEACQ